MAQQTVLMACTHHYHSPLQVGSHHLARAFADDGWDVHYMGAPTTPLHLARLGDPDVRARFAAARTPGAVSNPHGIREYVPFSLLAPDGRPILNSPAVTGNWHRTLIPGLRRLLGRQGLGTPSLLYIDNLSYHFLPRCLPHDRSVFRVMDMHEGFPGWKNRAHPLARSLARQADVTVYSARGLESYVQSLGPNRTAYVPNGVDFELFNSAPATPSEPLPGIPSPIALYAGAVDSRIDFEAVSHAARALPDLSFVFVGPAMAGCALPDMPENVYLTGPKPHTELPSIMRGASVGLVPFDTARRRDLLRGTRPLKLLEYMAAGLPVICADWEEVRRMQSPAILYRDKRDMTRKLRQAMGGHDPKPSIKFASKHGWERSYRLMLDALQQDNERA